MKRPKSYEAWAAIKQRCYNPKNPSFSRYGARGIGMQESWKNDYKAFKSYVEALPDFSHAMTLDRIDNDLGYAEGNLRWANRKAQAENHRMYASNTSGITGVDFSSVARPVGTDSYATARWQEAGKTVSKSFNIGRLGLMPAHKHAVVCRRQAIFNLILRSGAMYSGKHGL